MINKYFSLFFILMLLTVFPLSNGNAVAQESTYYKNLTNPFEVHNITENSSWTVYLNKSVYFIIISTNNYLRSYFNFTIYGNGLYLKLESEQFEFHGIDVNVTGIYYINTTGSGKWAITLDSQDPNVYYPYSIANTTAFVTVPYMSSSSEITINVSSTNPASVIIYNELLNKIGGYSINKYLNINLPINLGSESIVIIEIIPIHVTDIRIYWTPSSNNINNLTNENGLDASLYYVVFGIIVIAIVFLVIYKIHSKRGKNK